MEKLVSAGIKPPPDPPDENGATVPPFRYRGRIGRGGRIIFDRWNPLRQTPISQETSHYVPYGHRPPSPGGWRDYSFAHGACATDNSNFEAPEKLFSMGTKLAPWTTPFASSWVVSSVDLMGRPLCSWISKRVVDTWHLGWHFSLDVAWSSFAAVVKLLQFRWKSRAFFV
jgi:hypothetical protein